MTGDGRVLGRRSRTARQRVQDGWWGSAGMDNGLARQYKNEKRVENRVKRAGQLSIKVAHGRGGLEHDTEGEEE